MATNRKGRKRRPAGQQGIAGASQKKRARSQKSSGGVKGSKRGSGGRRRLTSLIISKNIQLF